jgi:hypothetical protein
MPRGEHAHHLEVLALPRLLVQHATACRVSYRLTPWVPNNQNAEVSHNTIRMANSMDGALRTVHEDGDAALMREPDHFLNRRRCSEDV